MADNSEQVQIGGFPLVRSNLVKNLWNSALILILFMFVSMAIIFFNWASRPPMRFIAINSNLGVTYLPYMRSPFLDSKGIENWVENTMMTAIGVSYANYNDRIDSLYDDFYPSAFNAFKGALSSSKLFSTIIKYRYSVLATPIAPPLIKNYAVLDGQPTWIVQFPALITLMGANGVSTGNKEKVVFTVTVKRVPLSINPRGVVIYDAAMTSIK